MPAFEGVGVTRVACGDYHSPVSNRFVNIFYSNLWQEAVDKCLVVDRAKNGQLGHNSRENISFPMNVEFLSKFKVTCIAAGGGYGCSHSIVLTGFVSLDLFSFKCTKILVQHFLGAQINTDNLGMKPLVSQTNLHLY